MKAILLSTLLVSSTLIYSQGRVDGFLKGKGNGDIAIGGGAEIAENYFAGTKSVGLSRTIINGSIFFAYGLHDRLDINVSLPYVSIDGDGDIQDGAVFLKYRLFEIEQSNGKFSILAAAGYSSNLTDYQTEGINAIGQQAQVIDGRLVMHYLWNTGWFLTGQFGVQEKSDPTPNSNQASLKMGKAMAKFYFDIWYDYQESDGGFDYLGFPAPSTFKSLGVDYHRAGATAYKPINEKLGAALGCFYTLSGRNVGQGIGINGALIVKL